MVLLVNQTRRHYYRVTSSLVVGTEDTQSTTTQKMTSGGVTGKEH